MESSLSTRSGAISDGRKWRTGGKGRGEREKKNSNNLVFFNSSSISSMQTSKVRRHDIPSTLFIFFFYDGQQSRDDSESGRRVYRRVGLWGEKEERIIVSQPRVNKSFCTIRSVCVMEKFWTRLLWFDDGGGLGILFRATTRQKRVGESKKEEDGMMAAQDESVRLDLLWRDGLPLESGRQDDDIDQRPLWMQVLV